MAQTQDHEGQVKKTLIIDVQPWLEQPVETRDNKVILELLRPAAEILRAGGTVIFPTETVYGLGAHALMSTATAKIYRAKGRPSDNPLIVHIADESALGPLIKELPSKAHALMRRFWPGPLTLVFEKSERIPLSVTGGLDTVAIRIPEHPIARMLIELAGVPVAAPSANLSGKPSPTKARHVLDEMNGRVDAIILGGDVDWGLESTVLDLTDNIPVLLRPGGVTLESIEAVVGPIDMDPTLLVEANAQMVPKAPGMKYRHYAPEAKVIVVPEHMSPAVLASKIEALESLGERVRYIFQSDANLLGKTLFDELRVADLEGYTIVLVRAIPQHGVGLAVMNRLLKAAGHKFLEENNG